MINSTHRLLGLIAVMVTVTHAGLGAQGSAQLPGDRKANTDREPSATTINTLSAPISLRDAFASEAARQVQATAPQKPAKKPMTRGTKAAIGAAIGGGIAAVIGFSLESQMDTPEGTGALLFGGIGAGLGALVGWNLKL